MHRHLFDSITKSLLGIRPGLELLAPVVIYVNFWGKHQTVVHGACCTILHSSQHWCSNFPAFSLILLFSIIYFFNNNQPNRCEVIAHCWFYLVFQTCHRGTEDLAVLSLPFLTHFYPLYNLLQTLAEIPWTHSCISLAPNSTKL